MSRNVPLRVMVMVAVILLYSLKLAISTDVEPFLDIVVLPIETDFKLV